MAYWGDGASPYISIKSTTLHVASRKARDVSRIQTETLLDQAQDVILYRRKLS